jgi:hypothetical protein
VPVLLVWPLPSSNERPRTNAQGFDAAPGSASGRGDGDAATRNGGDKTPGPLKLVSSEAFYGEPGVEIPPEDSPEAQ